MADLMKNYFASVIGKSEAWNFVRSLRKSLGRLTFNRPTIVAFFARCDGCLNRCSLEDKHARHGFGERDQPNLLGLLQFACGLFDGSARVNSAPMRTWSLGAPGVHRPR